MRNISPNKNTIRPLKMDAMGDPDSPRWLPMVMAASWFIGMISLFLVSSKTDISLVETLKWFTFFALLFTLVPYKWTVKLLPIEFHFMVIINIMGLGPVLTSLFLMLNLAFATNPVTKTSHIDYYHSGKEAFNGGDLVLELENDALQTQKSFRSFEYGQYIDEIVDHKNYTYTIEKGLFGYDVLVDFKFE
jgi:hypothetical protein